MVDINKRVVKKIPAEVILNTLHNLDDLINLLEPYLLILTPGERDALVKIGDGSFRFLELSHELAVDYPDLFPAFMQAAVFKEEFSTANELWSIINKINKLQEKINDTEMLAGNRALDFAIAFYQTVKIAARRDIPGARVIYEELKPRFPTKRQRQQKIIKDERQPELF